MPLSILSGKKEVLGVDLGTSMIKVLEAKVSGDKLSIINYGQINIGAQGIDEKSPEERKESYITSLKKLVGSKKFSTKNAAVSISGSSVIVRFVKFPKMSAADLEKTLQFEAEPHIPFDIQEVDMDTQIIGDVEEDGQAKMETILVASKKETIQDKIEIIESAGLSPAVIDVDAFAVENAYEFIHHDISSQAVMLVNIGASTTNISIVENGISKVVRDLYTAGNSFTRAIQNAQQVPTEKAEELKKKFGLTGKTQGEAGGDVGAQISSILSPVVKELSSEIQRSIDFFSGQGSGAGAIEKIVLSGGSADLKGLTELISGDIRMPVEIFRPLENVDTSGLKESIDIASPSLAVVAGLAIRKIGDHKIK